MREDMLTGAAEIAEFLGCNKRRGFYLLESKQIPAFKLGSIWVARKSSLLAYFDKLEGGEA